MSTAIKKIKEQAVLLERLEWLDNQILELDKMACYMADNRGVAKISLKFENTDKPLTKDPAEEKEGYGTWASMVYRDGGATKKAAPKYETTYFKSKVAPAIMLEIIGRVYHHFDSERKHILNQLGD